MRKLSTKGFSLIEGLLAMAVFLIGLSMLSSLLGDFTTFQRRFFRGDSEVVRAPEILSRVAAEVWEASDVVRPAGRTAETILELRKVDGIIFENRAARPYPAARLLYFDPATVTRQAVTYTLNAATGQLDRSGLGNVASMGESVTAFRTSRTHNTDFMEVELLLTVKDGERSRDWTTRVVKSDVW